jgi:catechol 2,3-dioxygenase-like lactoylglutathione lyase family enzyme
MKFNSLIPELTISDLARSINFYVKILGFKKEYERKESNFVFLSFQGSQIMLEEVNDNWGVGKLEKPFGRGINFQMDVKDIRPLIAVLKKNKYKLFRQPQDNWYRKGTQLLGNREFLVQDPDGYLLRFSQDIGSKIE